MKKLSNKGFTLVELIIVIAILAIIMLIAIPNFSGIQQRMQVNADKSTAAQIGKAVRIWYTEYESDPAFRAQVNGKVTANTGKDLPRAVANAPTAMVKLEELALVEDYVDNTYTPSSLRTASGATDTAQEYYVGIVGDGTYEKVVVCIANAAPNMPKFNTDGTSGLSTSTDVLYDGDENTVTDEPAKFKKSLAYLEP